MRILATADIHSPKYLRKFERVISIYKHEIENIDVALIAGDLMEKGNLNGLRQLVQVIRRFTQVQIYACPGNEDYDEAIEKAQKLIEDIRWIIDEKISVDIRNRKLTIIGSKGVLDRPTAWQARHIKNIYEIYRKRLELLTKLINETDNNIYSILLIHYAPTYKTLEGEDQKIWCYLGTSRLEKPISERNLLVIHGHAHRARRRVVKLGRSIIINASFPELYDLYLIEYYDNNVNIKILRSNGEIVKAEPVEEREEKRKGSSILDYV